MPPKKSKPFSRTKGVQGKRAQPKPTGYADQSGAPPEPPSVAGKRQQNSAEMPKPTAKRGGAGGASTAPRVSSQPQATRSAQEAYRGPEKRTDLRQAGTSSARPASPMVEDTKHQEPMETSAEAERGRADSSDDDDAGAIDEEQRSAAMPEDKLAAEARRLEKLLRQVGRLEDRGDLNDS